MSYEIFQDFERTVQESGSPEISHNLEIVERSQETETNLSTNEVQESLGESPYLYSEAYIDSNGKYHPQKIIGIYREAMENPESQELVKDLSCWQQQERPLSCAVQCQRMVIKSLTGLEVSEAQLREFGKERNLYQDMRGTYTEDVGKIAEQGYGLKREQYENMTVSELAEMKEQGAKLIVAVDSTLLEHPGLPKISTPNHAVEVIGFDNSDAENPKVILNDPGRADGKGAAYSLEFFEKAACGSDWKSGERTLHSVTAIYHKEGVSV